MNIIIQTYRIARFIPLILLLFVVSSYAVKTWSKIPAGSYKDSCKELSVIGEFLMARCQNDREGWSNTKINFTFCEGDIRNENGVLKCRQKPAPKPPAGSYSKTCKDIKVAGNELRAKCEKRSGNWKNTRIKYKKCDRDIWNDNGELSCKKKKGSNVPVGSYKNSCKDYYVESGKLYASCEKRNGRWNKSSIKYKNCDRDISNDNGELVCGNNNRGKLPKGRYKKSCKNIYKESGVLEADCKNKNGKWKHSSIKFKRCEEGLRNDNGKLRCN